MKSILLVTFLVTCAWSQKSVSKLTVLTTPRVRELEQTDCVCNGKEMDCSSQEKTTFSRNERCLFSSSTINLADNKITSLPKDAFASLPQLTLLFLQRNNLTELPKKIFANLPNLSVIMLSENNLKALPQEVFSDLKNITGISLWGNKLQILPPRLFAGLKTLNAVSLSDNQLSTIPTDLFSSITSLELIDLSRNRLTSVPRGLSRDLRSIKYLDLSGNQLTRISSEDLKGIREIYRLDLSDNMIASIPQYDKTWPRIRYSYWSGNKIERLPENVLRSWFANGEEIVLSMEETNPSKIKFFPPADLQWIVADDKIFTEVDGKDCRCGKLTNGMATVVLCVNVECGSGRAPSNWVSALRGIHSKG